MNLQVQGLSAGYPTRGQVLDDVTVTLGSGERTVLLGANGSGKTTLLGCLSGAIVPTAGSVLVDGAALKHSRQGLTEHRRRVQLVLQDPDDQLFSADVTQDVSFGPLNLGLPEAEARDRVTEALDLLGVSHLGDRPTHQLSYGEKKRVAVGGGGAMRPGHQGVEEATAGVAPGGVGGMHTAITRLEAHGTTVTMATHDVDLALAWGTSAIGVTAGRPTQGPVADLLADQALVEAAHLRTPWPLELAARLGWAEPPRGMDDVVNRLRTGA